MTYREAVELVQKQLEELKELRSVVSGGLVSGFAEEEETAQKTMLFAYEMLTEKYGKLLQRYELLLERVNK